MKPFRDALTPEAFTEAVDMALDVLELLGRDGKPNVVCFSALLLAAGGLVGVHASADRVLADDIWLQLSDVDARELYRTGFETMRASEQQRRQRNKP